MTTLLHDLRHALRQLRRQPLFAATAILTLAIGMGVNAVAFSVVNGLLFKTSAIGGGFEGIGRIATSPQDDEDRYASLAEVERFAAALDGVATVAAEGRSMLAWRHGATTEPAWVLFVSPHYFSMVTPPLRAGQLRVERRGADAPAAVIGERFWREKLGSPSLAGLTLRLNQVDVAVAGVVAESFTGPAGTYSPDVWLPLDDLAAFSTSPALQRRDARWLFVMARPNDGVTAAQVQGLIDGATGEMAREWPETHRDTRAQYWALGEANNERRGLATAAVIGMAVIGLVLLLACFNVANLLLAKAVERERDMGVRTALGAAPARLVRLVVTEGFVIAALSGAVALVLARWTQSLLGTFAIPIEQPQHIDLAPDGTVVLFIAILIVIAGVLPGLWPALSAARVDVLSVLGSQGASGMAARPARLRRWLVAAQVAGSTAFLAMAGLFLQSYGRIQIVDVGFDRDRLVLVEVEPALQGYDAARTQRYLDALAARVAALPGVERVAAAEHAPFFIGYDRRALVWPDAGTCDEGACASNPVYPVGDGYFETMGIAIAEGRAFRGAAAGEVVVNPAFAAARWPDGGSALGRTLRIGDVGTPVAVVGVTAYTRTRGLDRERPALFVPLAAEHYEGALTLVARAGGDPAALVRPIMEAATAVDPDVAPAAVKTMAQRMEVQMWPFRTLSLLLTICGTLALVLATVGLAGVVMHSVSHRLREFGVRLSVGATPRDLRREVLVSSTRLLLPGLAIGLAIAAGVASLAQAMLIGVNALNPLTYLAVAAFQSIIVLLACLGPAMRAAKTDPVIALRN